MSALLTTDHIGGTLPIAGNAHVIRASAKKRSAHRYWRQLVRLSPRTFASRTMSRLARRRREHRRCFGRIGKPPPVSRRCLVMLIPLRNPRVSSCRRPSSLLRVRARSSACDAVRVSCELPPPLAGMMPCGDRIAHCRIARACSSSCPHPSSFLDGHVRRGLRRVLQRSRRGRRRLADPLAAGRAHVLAVARPAAVYVRRLPP